VAQSRPVTIALDGFGAEQGFDVLAEGARRAAADGIGVRVFGPERSLGLQGVPGVEVVPTVEWIGNDDDPVHSVRERKGASVVRAAADVAEGNAAAMVSLGSTGATMAAATFGLRRLKGVQRPALAVRIPSPVKPVLFLDVGANVEVRPQHLVQFAFLGAAFSSVVYDVREPSVGLLTVGEEAGKGRGEIVEAHRMLTAAPGLNFVGNVEGGDLPDAKVDVVVTDGFTGNVTLKVMEGVARTLVQAISDAAHKNALAAAGGLLLKPALGGMRREFDPDTTGGAILLGLRAVTIVGHGSSGPEGVANAVRVAARSVKNDAVGRTAALLREGHAGRAALAADEDGGAGAAAESAQAGAGTAADKGTAG
jgi:glycerol-3-phosphate acyltransferase PlsX